METSFPKIQCIRDFIKIVSLCFILICLVALVDPTQDYYSLLGISKEATSREIRQAFKKLALKLHPDKNQNNPEAHENFLKINRAYEVLKDEDLRKKYDKYGEKGLEDHQEGGRYESWNFYRYDFGIYDDDPEIITLDRGEFDAAVGSGELWFVNFYSPRCSHCHDLAPTWREFAKEMDGLIRIGAVNCGDNRMLCRSKGINSYPSLYVFKSGMNPVKFYGDRSKESLTNFAMQYVTSTVTELWAGNFANTVETAFASGIGWLITFCTEQGEEWRSSALPPSLIGQKRPWCQTKAGNPTWNSREGLVKVGWMDCATQGELCGSLDISSSTTAYFPPGATLTNKEKGGVLYVNSLDAREIYLEVMKHLPDFDTILASTLEDHVAHHRWLIFFQFGKNSKSDTHDLKKLSVLLKTENIQVGKFDCLTAANICNSLYVYEPCVVVFKGRGMDNYEIHHDEHNIRAYPTTVVFNQSHMHEYGGHHSAEQILEFIEDLMNPSVISLTPDTFTELVKKRKKNEIWMLLNGLIVVGSVDCQKYFSLCHQENIQGYPEIRLFPQKSSSSYQHYSYNGWHRDAYSLRSWALGYLPQVSLDLTPQSFSDKVLNGKEHWVIDFYAPWCGPCQNFAPEFEILAKTVKGKVKAGKVDCQAYAHTCQSAGIRAYPTVKFYPYQGTKKNILGEQIDSHDAKVIAELLMEKVESLKKKKKQSSRKKGLEDLLGLPTFELLDTI
ncbi:hypothetical protein E2320_020123 [Naja naja]|nr:hypothetical protein E2320_020123 [Naja naja]